MLCNEKNNIPIKIPSHPYVLVNRTVLCNCGIEVKDNFLLELIATCYGKQSGLVMYFTVNTAFLHYFDNLTDALHVHISQDLTTDEQVLPISLQMFDFNSILLHEHESQNNKISKHSLFNSYIMEIFFIYSSNIIYDSHSSNCAYCMQACKTESIGNRHCFSANKGNRCDI